ncbi:TIGR02452 family protein [Streptomyces sp. NRRL B-24484]|uniref:TIGR02452 family protein n=1 Tax=Streptomyces sp. NRRL B-24484 TaxID=1463833 RepID=UPI0004C19AEF|nr:TIGR02452 family protein [Streptomyces sp. NRRL B-24484]
MSRMHQVAVENEGIAERGAYRTRSGAVVEIGPVLAAARAGTVSYGPDEPPGPGAGPFTGAVEVTAEGSVQAGERLVAGGGEHVAVLNFASARNPGGGYLRGAKAQEEDLCRSALLYRCLLEAPDYYEAHRASADLRYSHRVIWSPHVPVIRGSGGLLAEPYALSFLTSPAPNAGQLALRSGGRPVDVAGVLAERAVRVLAAAARHGVRELVLGAWGCGVFRNDPAVVADAFAAALESHGAAFDRVVFAVWDRSPVSANRAAFEARFPAV